MFELIVLALVVAALAALARTPVPKEPTESPARPVPPLWSDQTDWSRFQKPTYLRRGIVPGGSRARATAPGRRRCPSGQEAQPTVTEEAP
jgi:hypothetical protein